MKSLKSLRKVDFSGIERVLVRVDYNVSLGRGLQIVDDTRIRHTLPTVELLRQEDLKVFLCSHLGRPGGERKKELSLRPVGKHLERILGRKVGFVEDYEGGKGEEAIEEAEKGEVYLLENTRFYKGEKENSKDFSRSLARFGEVFVNDAFGVSHRRHASVVGVSEILPSYAGLSLRYEVKTIERVVEEPERPLVVIVGGAKVKGKLGMLEEMVGRADYVLLGGGMANTFLKAEGYEMGESFYEEEMVSEARRVLKKARKDGCELILPEDVVVGDLKRGESGGPMRVEDIPKNKQALDIGPMTCERFLEVIRGAETIIWNGPMGVFEKEEYGMGTDAVFRGLVENEEAYVVVGGGDTLAAISKKEHLERIDHVSTGGGAMLELIEEGSLPGLEGLAREG